MVLTGATFSCAGDVATASFVSPTIFNPLTGSNEVENFFQAININFDSPLASYLVFAQLYVMEEKVRVT